MRALCVVVPPPLLDDDLCFSQRIEDFPVEKFVPEACVEALDVAVLLGASRLNVGGLYSNHADPVAYGFSNKLRPIIGTNVGWYAMQNEEIGEDIDHIGRIEFPLHPNGQTFPTKLIQDVEGSEHAPSLSHRRPFFGCFCGWTLLTKVETSCDRILIAGGANVEAEWEQGPAV